MPLHDPLRQPSEIIIQGPFPARGLRDAYGNVVSNRKKSQSHPVRIVSGGGQNTG
jgi:hypothetical protein